MSSANTTEDLEQQILDVIVQESKIEPSLITPDATLQSLEVHSMDIVMILMAIEEKFGVYIAVNGELAAAKNLNQFVCGIADHIRRTHG